MFRLTPVNQNRNLPNSLPGFGLHNRAGLFIPNLITMKCIPLILVLFLFASANVFSQITDYQRHFATATQPGQTETLVVLRKWQQGGVDKMLIVHPTNLRTEVLSANQLSVQPSSWPEIRASIGSTTYGKALDGAYETDNKLRTVASAAANRHKKGLDLTLDLCAAAGPLNRAFFQAIIDKANADEKPVKLTVALTGKWMIAHADDLTWLKNLQKSNIMDITWANHSFHHHSGQNQMPQDYLPDNENDVLQTEKMMLANGITPSVYFSIPGVVTGPTSFDGAAEYGLVGINTDHWLSKGQVPTAGNLLVLANGNERLSGSLFLETLGNNRPKLLPWQWIYYEMGTGK